MSVVKYISHADIPEYRANGSWELAIVGGSHGAYSVLAILPTPEWRDTVKPVKRVAG
jgi:hypothetical protein